MYEIRACSTKWPMRGASRTARGNDRGRAGIDFRGKRKKKIGMTRFERRNMLYDRAVQNGQCEVLLARHVKTQAAAGVTGQVEDRGDGDGDADEFGNDNDEFGGWDGTDDNEDEIDEDIERNVFVDIARARLLFDNYFNAPQKWYRKYL